MFDKLICVKAVEFCVKYSEKLFTSSIRTLIFVPLWET